MKLLKSRIASEGRVIGTNIVKVDAFLNHQIDIQLMNQIGKAFYDYFKHKHINKILTVEASGIAIAALAALHFDVPLVFAKKAQSVNLDGALYTSKVYSFTKKRSYDVIVEKKFLNAGDNILILDDFLAEGNACLGLIDIIEQSGATLSGIGIAIEKGFQRGGREIRARGYDLYSLAIIESMSEKSGVVFR